MYSRKIRLLRALVENERLSSAELMEKLRIGQRTLRTEISELNDILRRKHVYIYSHRDGGYYIKQEHLNTARYCLNHLICQSKQIVFPESFNERFLFGFVWLFFLKKPVSIQRAAEKLYSSNTSMLQTKKRIQDMMDWYPRVRLETSVRGMWIEGEEADKRHILAQFINYSTFGSVMMERIITFLFGSEMYQLYLSIYHALPELLSVHGYRLIDKSIEGFALDIFITLMRSEQGFLLSEEGNRPASAFMESLCALLASLDHPLSVPDCAYLSECLKAKRIFYTLGMDYHVPEEYHDVTEAFLRRTDEACHTEYLKNQELFIKLSVHIMKMVQRLQNGYFETNTILEHVKERYGKELVMATGINQILESRYQLTANDHELSYLAIYLRAYSSRRLTAVVLCDLGSGIADNMVRQITYYCGEKIHILGTMSLAEYRMNPLPTDILVSASRIYDVKLPEKTKIFYVDYLLKKEQLKKIQDFLLKNM